MRLSQLQGIPLKKNASHSGELLFTFAAFSPDNNENKKRGIKPQFQERVFRVKPIILGLTNEGTDPMTG